MRRAWALLVLGLMGMSVLSLGLGPTGCSFSNPAIILQVRLPRVLLGILAGGVLSFVGTSLQGVLQNPLVDPYILGVASGGAFGASLALVMGQATHLSLPIFAFLGAFLAMALVYALARIAGKLSKVGIIMAGVAIGFLFSALVMLVMVLSRKPLAQIVYILLGNLGLVFTRELGIGFAVVTLISIIAMVVVYGRSRELNILGSGEEAAQALGVDTRHLSRELLLLSSLLVGLVVAFTGSIAFVGLMIPHIVRLRFGPDHRVVLPASFLLGATFLLGSDLVARSIAPVELPLSVVTSIFGVPYFIYLMRTRL